MSESVDPLDESILDEAVSRNATGTRITGTNTEPLSNFSQHDELSEKDGLAEKKPETEKPYRLWDERRKLAVMFGKVYILIMVVFIGVLSLYWGSIYRREYRVANMKMLVVIEDSQVQLTNSTTAPELLGEAVRGLINESSTYGDFRFANVLELSEIASQHDRSLFEEVEKQVHEQKYWACIYVNATASQIVYDLLSSGNALSVYAFQLQYIVSAVYESGRHFSALSQYVTKNLRIMESLWLSNFAPHVYATMVENYLTDDQRQNLVRSSNSTQVPSALSVLPSINMVDQRLSLSSTVLGPSELGLIYAQIFSFHQFNFSVDLHNSVKDKLQFGHYVLYRIMISQCNHFVLALVYSLMTIAFRVPIDSAFGGPGFLILWLTMFLFISASGGINETVVSWILYKDKKALLAPFMIFYIVINIAPTFAPLVLSPGFYRYGYATPMYNAYEALKVVFFNTWRGTLGRNYGILGAWIVASNLSLILVLKRISDATKEEVNKKKGRLNSKS